MTVHLPHEITWNGNLMQQGNFIDHHPSINSVQKTICCNSTSNAPDDGRMYPKHVQLRIHQYNYLVASSWHFKLFQFDNFLPVELNLLEQQHEDLRSRIMHFTFTLVLLATTYKMQSVWFLTLCVTRTLF